MTFEKDRRMALEGFVNGVAVPTAMADAPFMRAGKAIRGLSV